MVLSITTALAEHLVEETEDEYQMGENDCASRVMDVIDAVMQGEDPMSVEQFDAMDIMKLADAAGDAAQFRPRETDVRAE